MRRYFLTLIVIAAVVTISSLASQVVAQSPPLQELRVTITGYSTGTLTPASTVQVRFTVHKPAGIKITDGYLSAYAIHYVDNQGMYVSTQILGSSEVFYSPSFDEQDSSEELVVKISENASVGQTIYIEVAWVIEGVTVSISENENQVTVISGGNTFTAPIVYTSTSGNVTRYFLIKGLTNFVWVQSDKLDTLYVVGRGSSAEIVPITIGAFPIMAIAPSVAAAGIGLIIYLVARKPRWSRAISFIGGLVAIPLAILASMGAIYIVLNIPGLTLIATYAIFSATAGLTEEPLKVVGLAALAAKFPKRVASRREGLLCGALAGLGFGLVESIFFFLVFPSYLIFIGRLAVSIPFHVGLSAMVGLGIYYACVKKGKHGRWWRLLVFLALAILIHVAFDFTCFWLISGG